MLESKSIENKQRPDQYFTFQREHRKKPQNYQKVANFCLWVAHVALPKYQKELKLLINEHLGETHCTASMS